MKCRICGEECKETYPLKATLYGTKGTFSYMKCSSCGCLQICKPPKDMSIYYNNSTYYSLNMDERKAKNQLLFLQLKNQIESFNLWGALTQLLYPVNYKYFSVVNKDSNILDVGCGDGEMLRWLNKLGFRNLWGMDPYATPYSGNYTILDTDILNSDIKTKFDLITFIHSLEHLYSPNEVIQKASTMLSDRGYIAVTIPFFSNYYWNKYGENLYTLDPPRHFYLHTKKSMCTLMESNGLKLVSFVTEFDPAIPIFAKNVRNNHTEKNQGTPLLLGTITSLASKGLRKRLIRQEDGAIATFLFQKTQRNTI